MALFKKSEPVEEPQPTASQSTPGAKKAVPTPSRREAEAARRARLNPQLSPKEARRREREAQARAREKALTAQDAEPARVLLRDFVDSRFNLAEFAMPVLFALLLVTMAMSMVPGLVEMSQWFLFVSWGYIGLMMLDTFVMWRKYKVVLADRYPGTPLQGLLSYGFNRQFTFRRWRRPAPRVKRGGSY
ncbi:MAG: DUF3043 domain-containing protein [Propioniciclava sp.]|uniref:DUF3043 domain-containing protein n=1 Tax=Propioniciclava sp. TaxID=2038686 RepID=UPI0039E72888